MRNDKMDMLYPPTPECFHDAMWKTVDDLREGHFSGIRRRTVVLAVALLLVLAGAAYAAAAHFGVLTQLRKMGFEPMQGAEDLVSTMQTVPTVSAGGVQFELTESAYDGEQFFLSIKMHSDKFPVLPAWAWVESVAPGTVYANVQGVYINGEEAQSFDHADGTQEDGEAYGMIIVPYRGESNPEIKLNFSVYHEDTDSHDECTMSFLVPAEAASPKTLTMKEPASMNGVTVSEMEMRFSKLKLYITLKYTIDPELPRFERLRRQLMFFELTAPNRSITSHNGYCSWSDEEQAYVVQAEYSATEEPFDTLDVILQGRDGEVYWQQTVNFEEEAK